MKKNYTEADMLKVIQEVEAEFSQALSKAEAEVETEAEVEDTSSENFEQEVTELYASMEKSEAEAHLKALSKVLNVSDMNKSEEDKILKSEIETIKSSNEELKKSNEELKKNLEQAVTIISKITKAPAAAPARKAIVSEMDYIKKSEEENEDKKEVKNLSKSEISEKLKEQIRSGKLAKKDSDAIISYYDNKTNLDSIKHLL
jgi:hypothetical protein